MLERVFREASSANSASKCCNWLSKCTQSIVVCWQVHHNVSHDEAQTKPATGTA